MTSRGVAGKDFDERIHKPNSGAGLLTGPQWRQRENEEGKYKENDRACHE
jgi:hypothetical protein